MPERATALRNLTAVLRSAGCVRAEEEAALLLDEARDTEDLDDRVARRCAGEPLEQVLGWAEFAGRRYAVEPGVFVPRQRSLALVEAAVAGCRPGSVVVDLCCGTAALGLAIADRVSVGELHVSDRDPAAVRCARRNMGDRGQVYSGDLFEALPGHLRGRVEVIVANAPYVPTDQVALLPREARDHEDRVALDGGPDGLGVHRRILAEVGRWLAPGACVLFEVGAEQRDAATESVAASGLAPVLPETGDPDTVVVIGARSGPARSRS